MTDCGLVYRLNIQLVDFKPLFSGLCFVYILSPIINEISVHYVQFRSSPQTPKCLNILLTIQLSSNYYYFVRKNVYIIILNYFIYNYHSQKRHNPFINVIGTWNRPYVILWWTSRFDIFMRMWIHLIWTGVKCHFSLLRMDICLIRAKNVTTKTVIELFEMNKRWLSLVRDTTIKYFASCKKHSTYVGGSPRVISWCWSLKVGNRFQKLGTYRVISNFVRYFKWNCLMLKVRIM